MKALFHDTLVEVIEKSDKGYRIMTAYGVITIEAEKIMEIPDELIKPYESELSQIETFIMHVREKAEEIDIRYLKKKQELDDAITKAKARKNEIIDNFKANSLNFKSQYSSAEMEQRYEKT